MKFTQPPAPQFGTLERPVRPSAQELAAAEAAAQAEAWRRLQPQRHCARLCSLAYESQPQAKAQADWRISVFDDKALNLQALACLIDGEAYVAFRGTKGPFLLSTNWRAVNLRAGFSGEPGRHRGFLKAWRALKLQVVAWLMANRPTALNLSGHSMGAAVAQLAALELAAAWPVQRVILFATPMLGAAAFNQAYDATVVANSTRTLQQATVRYLLLSDAISLPLPRLLGYQPGLPIQCIDRTGAAAGRVPSLAAQTLAQISPTQEPPVIGVTLRGALARAKGEADLGEPNLIEQQMGVLRTLALAAGGPYGWFVLLGVAAGNALARAIGFHRMQGYAWALGVRGDAVGKP